MKEMHDLILKKIGWYVFRYWNGIWKEKMCIVNYQYKKRINASEINQGVILYNENRTKGKKYGYRNIYNIDRYIYNYKTSVVKKWELKWISKRVGLLPKNY